MIKHHKYTKYSATRDGKVYGPKGQEVKGRQNRYGYLQFLVGYYTESGIYTRKTVLKHRFIYEALTGTTLEPIEQINHIDGCKTNNTISNLEVCNASHNVQHAFDTGLAKAKQGSDVPWTTLQEEDIRNIIRDISSSNPTNIDIAVKYNTTVSIVSNIRHKNAWLHVFNEEEFRSYVPVEANNSKAGVTNLSKELRLQILKDLFTTTLTNRQIQDKYNIQYKHLAKVRKKELWKKEIAEYENSL
jgi:hypothetical protein